MKIQLLIATQDSEYVEHLSQVLTEKYADVFEVNICSTAERLQSVVSGCQFDAALLESPLVTQVSLSNIRLPLLLWWDSGSVLGREFDGFKRIRKYQRISSIASEVMEQYAAISDLDSILGSNHSHMTVVWSPVGGSGKTTTALAYAAQKVAEGKKTVYLDLQAFSDASVYFPQTGKSISTLFGKLGGNIELLLQSIRQQDSGSGIYYFCQPENYDDISILTTEDIRALVKGCSGGMDELVVDLSCTWEEKTQKLLEMADSVFLVLDNSSAGKAKWEQFRTQHNMFESIRKKMILVANRGARLDPVYTDNLVSLPIVQSKDPIVVYKTLSAAYFV